MKELNQAILKHLCYDPITEAERLAGVSWKEDESVVGMSMPLMHANSRTKEELLTLNDDTRWGLKIPDWLRLADRLGFKLILEEEISDGNKFRIFWNPKGFLLAHDSYSGDTSINGGSVYCFYHGPYEAICTAGGGSISPQKEDGLYSLSKDIREGLRMFMESLLEAGEVLPEWPETPFLWLLSYADTKDKNYDYPAINAARIKRLPVEVQMAIQPSLREI